MTAAAQPTAQRLAQLIATAPKAVAELLNRYDCTVPASPEVLAAMYAVKGEVFADDLFILLTQAEKATPQGRYASAVGPTATVPISQQRSGLSRGLQAIGDFLRSAGIITTSGSTHGVDYNATNDPSQVQADTPRILGLSQPVFVLGLLAVVLLAVVLFVQHHRKK